MRQRTYERCVCRLNVCHSWHLKRRCQSKLFVIGRKYGVAVTLTTYIIISAQSYPHTHSPRQISRLFHGKLIKTNLWRSSFCCVHGKHWSEFHSIEHDVAVVMFEATERKKTGAQTRAAPIARTIDTTCSYNKTSHQINCVIFFFHIAVGLAVRNMDTISRKQVAWLRVLNTNRAPNMWMRYEVEWRGVDRWWWCGVIPRSGAYESIGIHMQCRTTGRHTQWHNTSYWCVCVSTSPSIYCELFRQQETLPTTATVRTVGADCRCHRRCPTTQFHLFRFGLWCRRLMARDVICRSKM